MVFNNFRVNVIARILLLVVFLFLAVWIFLNTQLIATPVACFVLAGLITWNLIYYIETSNRHLVRLLDSLHHNDFSSSLPIKIQGQTFNQLKSITDIIVNSFRRVRRQKESNLLLLEAIMEHVQVALICIGNEDKIKLINIWPSCNDNLCLRTNMLDTAETHTNIRPFNLIIDITATNAWWHNSDA